MAQDDETNTNERVHSLERKIDKLDVKFDGFTGLLDERWKAVTKSIEDQSRHQDMTMNLISDTVNKLSVSHITLKESVSDLSSDQRVSEKAHSDLESKVNDIQGNQRWLGRTVVSAILAEVAYVLAGSPHPH